ncbi:galactose-3-O-sulfotransferase-domain-containing protein [Cladochytrium replicatum]|nr:galactose-3-O-sulfotransferase-domain-containing protein [Cladochytrium replicatum]
MALWSSVVLFGKMESLEIQGENLEFPLVNTSRIDMQGTSKFIDGIVKANAGGQKAAVAFARKVVQAQSQLMELSANLIGSRKSLQIEPQQQRRYIFIKTHKTGSTTLGSIFFRYGVRHKLKIFKPGHHYASQLDFEPDQLEQHRNHNSDIFLNHFQPEYPFEPNENFTTEHLINMYRRAVPGGMAVTVLREPNARFVSHYYYLVYPTHRKITLDDYATDRTSSLAFSGGRWSLNWNRQCQELGIRSGSDLRRFLRHDKKRYFGMILITELFDESLVLMRRKFQWTAEDILYVKMLDSCSDGHRWDNREVQCSATTVKQIFTGPEFAKTRKLIERANRLDTILYNAVRKDIQKELDAQGADFWKEVAALKENIAVLKDRCRQFSTLNNPGQLELMRWTQNVSESRPVRNMRIAAELASVILLDRQINPAKEDAFPLEFLDGKGSRNAGGMDVDSDRPERESIRSELKNVGMIEQTELSGEEMRDLTNQDSSFSVQHDINDVQSDAREEDTDPTGEGSVLTEDIGSDKGEVLVDPLDEDPSGMSGQKEARKSDIPPSHRTENVESHSENSEIDSYNSTNDDDDAIDRLDNIDVQLANKPNRIRRRSVTVSGRKVEPYPCFPYSISDMHYERLIRLSQGRVVYIPGLVPSSQDRMWRKYSFS